MRFTLIFLCFWPLVCRAQQSPAGRWEGSIQIPERELNLIVDLDQQSGGRWIGSFIIPGLDIAESPLTDVAVKQSAVSFAMKSVNGRGLDATVTANLESNGTLKGEFNQAGHKATFVLNRAGSPQVELPPHSTSIGPDFEGEWKGEYELSGYARHVTLKLTNVNKENGAAEFIIVGKKINNLPVDLIEQSGAFVTIYSHETGITYEGRLNPETNTIGGTLLQGPIELALVLHRSK